MKFYLDTEFIECAKQRRVLGIKVGPPVPTIDLISIALVAEDGREFSALNADCELRYAWANEWVRENVLRPIWETYAPTICRNTALNYFSFDAVQGIFWEFGVRRGQLAWNLLTFVHAEAYEGWVGSADDFFKAPFTDEHQFYGYYCDYDWVAFCQLFGRMTDLPKGFPMYCYDLKQELDRLGITKEQKQLLCPDPVNEHTALADARWNKRLHEVLERRGAREVTLEQATTGSTTIHVVNEGVGVASFMLPSCRLFDFLDAGIVAVNTSGKFAYHDFDHAASA